MNYTHLIVKWCKFINMWTCNTHFVPNIRHKALYNYFLHCIGITAKMFSLTMHNLTNLPACNGDVLVEHIWKTHTHGPGHRLCSLSYQLYCLLGYCPFSTCYLNSYHELDLNLVTVKNKKVKKKNNKTKKKKNKMTICGSDFTGFGNS